MKKNLSVFVKISVLSIFSLVTLTATTYADDIFYNPMDAQQPSDQNVYVSHDPVAPANPNSTTGGQPNDIFYNPLMGSAPQATPFHNGAPQGTSNNANPSKPGTLSNPLNGIDSVAGLILAFMKIVSYLAVIVGVLLIMWVGLQFVLARGNPAEITKRANQLLFVVVGIGVILGARILVSVVINTLGATGTVNPSIIQGAHNVINSQ